MPSSEGIFLLGLFGTSFSDGQLVKTADAYDQFFTALDTEVKNRAASYVPAPAPTTAAPQAAAPATGSQN